MADQVADLPPLKWQFEIHTYKIPTLESSVRSSGRSGGKSTPLKMAI